MPAKNGFGIGRNAAHLRCLLRSPHRTIRDKYRGNVAGPAKDFT